MHDLTGKISGVSFSYTNGKPLVTLEMNENKTAMDMVYALKDHDKLSIKIGRYKAKRSLDANSYYWCLVNKLAAVLKISTSYCHNVMLRRYGAYEEMDGCPLYLMIPDTEEAEKQADESEKYHIKPTSQVREGKDGKMYRTYIMLKGSHSFDTAEMSRLISGIRDECRAVGIQYETPDEIANLLSLTGGR